MPSSPPVPGSMEFEGNLPVLPNLPSSFADTLHRDRYPPPDRPNSRFPEWGLAPGQIAKPFTIPPMEDCYIIDLRGAEARQFLHDVRGNYLSTEPTAFIRFQAKWTKYVGAVDGKADDDTLRRNIVGMGNELLLNLESIYPFGKFLPSGFFIEARFKDTDGTYIGVVDPQYRFHRFGNTPDRRPGRKRSRE